MKTIAALLVVGAAMAFAAPAAWAVNCAQVNKYLGTGRTTKDVAETMMISEDDVKKCQAEAAKNGHSGQPAAGSAAAGGSSSSSDQGEKK